MVLTDPPYGVLDFKWDNEIDNEKLWQELKRVIKPNCIIALFGIEPFSTQVRLSNIKNYKYDWYWKKSAVGGFINAKKRPLKTLENIMVFSDGVPRYYPQGLVRLDKKSPERQRSSQREAGGMVRCIVATAKQASMYKNLPIIQDIFWNLAILTAQKGVCIQPKNPPTFWNILSKPTPMRKRRC
ncbi:site-specific DNA-methyltransferase [Moraxella bovis]|uniref:site-specific DNA-methyltransferase n=1 Tax=Moraxella bovis TaxID=476 RepID=UPI001D175E26|nr:site-specific DNA-methyltransferase [Moraxella bovis]